MTPDQWAETIGADVWARFNRGEPPAESGELKKRIAEVVRRAVAEERAECVTLAHDHACDTWVEMCDCQDKIAAAIITRGGGKAVMCIRCETMVPESEVGMVDQLEGHSPNYTCKECLREDKALGIRPVEFDKSTEHGHGFLLPPGEHKVSSRLVSDDGPLGEWVDGLPSSTTSSVQVEISTKGGG